MYYQSQMTASYSPLNPDPRQALRHQIDPLLEAFDFERVHRAMVALGWTYTGEKESPDSTRLRETARALLQSVVDECEDHQLMTSGGFRGWRYESQLYLTFEIAAAYAEPGKVGRL